MDSKFEKDLKDEDLKSMTAREQVAFLNQFLAGRPGSSKAFHFRGKAKRELGDLTGAIEDYNEAIRLDPENAWAYTSRGLAKRQIGDTQGSWKDISEAAQLAEKILGK